MCGEFMRLVTRQHSEHVPGLLDLVKHQRRVAFVAETLDHSWPAFLGHVDAIAVHLNHVHLKRLHQKRSGIAAVWTGQRH